MSQETTRKRHLATRVIHAGQRTPSALFDRERDGYSLMQPGDTVRFESVDHAEFIKLVGDDTPLEAQA